MAVAYRSSSQQGAGGGGTAIVTKPAGTVENDLLVAIVSTNSGPGSAPSAPSGWTIHSASISADARLYYKVAGASEPASYEFVAAVLSTVDVNMACLSGADPANPFDQVTGVASVTTGNIVIPTLTPGGTKFLFQIVKKTASGAFTPPGTATERYDANSGGLTWGGAGGDETVSAATGTRTWDPASTANQLSIGYMMSLNSTDRSGGGSQAVAVGLSGVGSTGTSKGSSLAETVSLSAQGGPAHGGSLAPGVALSAAGATNVYGAASQVVTADRVPTESTINEAEGTETVQLDGGGQTGAASGASRAVSAGLTAAVAYGTTGDPELAAATNLVATGNIEAFQGAELGVTAGRSASGSANYSQGASLAATVARSAEGLAVRRFLTPTQSQSMPDHFWGRYVIPVGVSLVKIAGHYATLPTPTNDELVAAGDEGTDWFRGGYEYVVSEEVWDALVADGFAQA